MTIYLLQFRLPQDILIATKCNGTWWQLVCTEPITIQFICPHGYSSSDMQDYIPTCITNYHAWDKLQ